MVDAVANVAGSIIGASGQKSAAKSAAAAQTAAANQANQTQLQMYNQSRQDALPHINAGNAATSQLAYLLGLRPQSSPMVDSAGQPINQANNTATNYTQINSGGVGDYNPSVALNDQQRQVLAIYHPEYLKALNTGGRAADEIQGDLGDFFNAYNSSNPSSNSNTNTTNSNSIDPFGAEGQYAGANADTGAFGSLTKNFTSEDFLNGMDPAYQFDMQQGLDAIQRTQSANGGLQSGAAAKAINDYAQGTASNEYSKAYDRFNTNQTNLFNRLSGVAGSGQQATNTLTAAGSNAANQIGNNTTGAGAAQGAAYTAAANANSNMYGNIAGQAQNLYNGFSGLFGSNSSSSIPSAPAANAASGNVGTFFEF